TVGKFTSKAQFWRPSNGRYVTETTQVCTKTKRGQCTQWQTQTNTYWDGDAAEWRALNTSDRAPMHVDCAADVTSPGNAGNRTGQSNGYPFQPSAPDANNSQAYTANRTSSNVNWGSTTYTFYSAHYMNWLYDSTILSVQKTRMSIAKDVVSSLINTNP